MSQEQQRLLEKFGASPFSDKSDCLVLLEQFRESESRLIQARGGFYYTPGLGRYADDGEAAKKDSSADAEPTNTEDDEQPVNSARRKAATGVALHYQPLSRVR